MSSNNYPLAGNDQLWAQVMATAAVKVGQGAFQTWFQPIKLAGWNQNSCQITVPNQTFRQAFLDHYADILKSVLRQLAGAPVILDVEAIEAESAPDLSQIHPLPVVHAAALETETEPKPWLIEQLWTRGAVGILGGPPKLLKTWLALEMAVSVACHSSCLGTFPVHASGPVLLFAAEDSQTKVRERLASLARHHGFDLEQINIRVITADTLRLDRTPDQERLTATILLYKPILLVLDPLVRLHSLDENQSGPMAALLGYFRALQRKTGTAIAIVHHARKNISSSTGAGYSLRGSGDLYAWVDSFICLQRRRDRVTFLAEHRSAPGFGPVPIELASAPDETPFLRLAPVPDHEKPAPDSLPNLILQLLTRSQVPLTTDDMRSKLHIRKQRVVEALRGLCAKGTILRIENGFALYKRPEQRDMLKL